MEQDFENARFDVQNRNRIIIYEVGKTNSLSLTYAFQILCEVILSHEYGIASFLGIAVHTQKLLTTAAMQHILKQHSNWNKQKRKERNLKFKINCHFNYITLTW